MKIKNRAMTTYFVVPLNSLRIGTKSKRDSIIVFGYFSTFVNFGYYGGQRFLNLRNGGLGTFLDPHFKIGVSAEFYR